MRMVALIVSAIFVVVGAIWVIQGAGIWGGTMMSGVSTWLWLGVGLLAVGLAGGVWFGLRGR